MSVILVVETDASYAQRISEAMQSAGLPVEVCENAASAIRRASIQPPRLLIASSAVPEARSLLRRFARSENGPGSVVMIPTTLIGRVSAHDYHADALLPKPFTSAEVQKVLSPLLTPAPAPQTQLSSLDIFGDVLAEVESAVSSTRPGPTATPRSSSDDINRKLEETLSGVLQSPEAESPRHRSKSDRSKEIDDLLDKTLSSLELEMRPKKRPPASRNAPPASRQTPPAPAAAIPTANETVAPAESPMPAPPDTAPIARADSPPAAGDSPPSRDIKRTGSVVFEPPPPLEAPPPPDISSPATAPVAATNTPAVPSSAPRPDAELAVPETLDDLRTRQLTVVPAREAMQGEVFGDYTLIKRIAVGGMAEVWQARRRGVEGFQKTVAIKRILSHLTGSVDFVTMFIDEAKLAAQLNHNNIIQIYDLGKVGEDFFIAMEYVDGMDLRTILNAAREKRRPLPVGLAAMIASSVARALDYAHRKRDFDNRALGLVHRDVSPQNVLISYEGEIKLCDFGIVKAVAKASTTQMGALKGKLQYMSPEQAWGKSVDARSDIFSLGAVFFEILTGTRLFAGDSEIGVLDAVRECRIQGPREIVPQISEEIDRIVRRALAKTAEERYQTAGEMETDLKGALVHLKPMPSQSELANYMHALASAPVAEDEESAVSPEGEAERSAAVAPPDWSPPPEPDRLASTPAPAREPTSVEDGERALALEAPTVVPAPAPKKPDSTAATKTGSKLTRLLFAALLVAVIGVVLFFVLRSPRITRQTDQPTSPETPDTPAREAGGGVSTPAATDVTSARGTPQGEIHASEATPSSETSPLTSPPAIDLQELVNQEMTKKAEEIRKEFEAKKRKLEQQLEEARRAADAPPGDAGTPPGDAGKEVPVEEADEGGGGGASEDG